MTGSSEDRKSVSDGFFVRRFPNLTRHLMILRASWKDQNTADENAKPQSDHEFLPAALEIMEKPPSPGLRWLMLILCSLFLIAILWSFIGKVDVVATATGKVVPSSSSKVIQPIEIGSIRAIHVRNGQQVKKGQLLLELDPTISTADETQSSQQLLSADIVQARNYALLVHLQGRSARFVPPPGTPVDVATTQAMFVRSAIGEYEAQKASLEQQRAERQAQLAGSQAEISKLEQTLPLLDQQLDARQELADKGYFSKLRLLEFEQLSEATGDQAMAIFEKCVEEGWVLDGVMSQSLQQLDQLWQLRERISESIAPHTPYKNDISVTVSKVPDFVEDIDTVVQDAYPDFEIVWFGHIGDGNMHLNILKPADLAKEDFFAQCNNVSKWVFEIVEKYNGSISAEHGVGMTKKPYLEYSRSPEEIACMKAVKHVFDPNNVMNPGKLFDV